MYKRIVQHLKQCFHMAVFLFISIIKHNVNMSLIVHMNLHDHPRL